MSSSKSIHTAFVKQEAARLGFMHCGISKAEFLEKEASALEKWLQNEQHGKMKYMENHFDKRLDPRLLVEGAKSVVSLLLNYFPSDRQEEGVPKISKYAYGKDYHFVIREKLFELVNSLRSGIGDINGRVFVDSAPVMDKAWAKRSGLGWMGKNTNIINPRTGSFFFIAELIIDLELEPDGPIKDYCGACTKCIDACPTEAIVSPYVLDASKCISYLTIELKESIPEHFRSSMDNWVFGCDVCQDVCPWNRFSSPHSEPLFNPGNNLLGMKKEEWMEMTEETFDNLFKDSAVQRTGFKGLKRNLSFLKGVPGS